MCVRVPTISVAVFRAWCPIRTLRPRAASLQQSRDAPSRGPWPPWLPLWPWEGMGSLPLPRSGSLPRIF